MANPTLTKTWDDLHTSTWERKGQDLVDIAFNKNPTLFMLQKRGRIVNRAGGTDITIPLEYGENATVTSIGRGSKISIVDNEKFHTAVYPWKWIACSIVSYMTDVQKNKGEAAIFNQVEANLKNARKSIEKSMNTMLMGDGSGNSNLDIDGFKKYVPTTYNSGSIGGIDTATNPKWETQYTSMSGLDHTVYLIDYMRTMFNNCSDDNGGDSPNHIITTQGIYEWYEDEVSEIHQLVNKNELADAGFKTLEYKGCPMTWTSVQTAGYMHFLNLDYFELSNDPSKWFEMTEWKNAQDSLDRVCQIVAQGNLTCSNRRRQGLIAYITT
jgi:hypothetical protein